MNEIPIINYLPEKWRGWAMITILAFPYVTRGVYALMSGGGIVGLFRGILFGANTPKNPEQ